MKKLLAIHLILILFTSNLLAQKVKISTQLGDIVVLLDAEKAPLTSANFLRYVEGDYYKGAFRDGEFSGSGRFEATDGAVYEGMFVEGLPEGQGRYIEADGRVIAGEFKAGWPDGQVSVTTPDGATLTEYWAEGRKEEPKKED